ncbi:MAG: ABC transporter substrate-binding protein [Anaerolinea sp.]|nr:ABC transporter substrate-binding protein [Anaerolinea sp.]
MRILHYGLALLASLILAACAPVPLLPAMPAAAPATAPATVRVCSSLSSSQTGLQVALAERLDEKYGIDLDVTAVNSAATAAAALLAGEFDICQQSAAALVSAAAAGGDLVIVGGVLNSQPYFLITRPEIKQAADLIGKALAISGPGSSSDFAARTALEYLGLRPDQDVTLQTIGGASERIAAMQAGAIAGTILAPPEAMTVLAEGNNLLVDFSNLDKAYQHIAVMTTREYLREHPERVEAFLKATAEAVARMHADKALTLRVLAGYLDLDPLADAAALDLTYDLVIQKLMQVDPMPSLPGIQALIDDLSRENPAVANLKPEDVVDLTLVDKLQAEGFFQGLQSQ